MSIVLVFLVLLKFCFSVIPGPVDTDWMEAYEKANLFYYNETLTDAIMLPHTSNGCIGHVAMSDVVYAAGVFNGRALDGNHRAEIPNYDTRVYNQSFISYRRYALHIEEGIFYYRYYLESLVMVEERFYAHAVIGPLLVHEMLITNPHSFDYWLMLESFGKDSSPDFNFTVIPSDDSIHILVGQTLIPESLESGVVTVARVCTNYNLQGMMIPAYGTTILPFLTVIVTSLNSTSGDPLTDAMILYNETLAIYHDLHKTHIDAWKTRWEKGRIEISGDFELAQAVNSSLFAILSAIRSDYPHGLSPGGFSNVYSGHTFWDQDTWMYPALLLLHPGDAYSCLLYRSKLLNGAFSKATLMGYSGAMFPWESAMTGVETMGENGIMGDTGIYEQHVSGDVSFAFFQWWQSTHDMDYLKNIAFPVLYSIAQFWASRASFDSYSNTFSINDIMGPDEYHSRVNNSCFTNVVAKIAISNALAAAELIGFSVTVPANWSSIANGLIVPFDTLKKYHLEFQGFTNETIKQADTVLIGFPFNYDMPIDVRSNDITFYSRITDFDGPAMTWGNYAINWLDIGNSSEASKLFPRTYKLNVMEPFKVWSENINGEGNPNFITGAGGFLQLIIFGYGGLRLHDDYLLFNPPMLPQNATLVVLHGINYLDNEMCVEISNDIITIKATVISKKGLVFYLEKENTYYILKSGVSLKFRREEFPGRFVPNL